MLQDYKDITSRLGKPIFFDECGCPRYALFHPSLCANIYAEEAILLLIACQQCGSKYKVAMSWHKWIDGKASFSFSKRVKDGHFPHYGDPPCFECTVGATMNCHGLAILEFWKKGKDTGYEWERDSSLEIDIPR